MDAGSIERLFLRRGEQVTAQHMQQLAALVARQTRTSGRGVRQRHLPWGTITSASSGSAGGGESPIFLPSVKRVGDGFDLTWEPGTIGGVQPVLEFHVPAGSFNALGECLVYFRCELSQQWSIAAANPFAAAETPPLQPWIADKLALVLYDDGSYWRALVSNQRHLAINRRSSGLAQHLFWGFT